MMRLFLLSWLLLAPVAADTQPKPPFAMDDYTEPPFAYWTTEPKDRFSLMMEKVRSGELALDTQNELSFLTSLLKAMDIPVSSQLLLFSGTSLQKRLINHRNPRALYFNEHTYVGFVPGGKVEVASFDPQLGMVFFIFDPLGSQRTVPALDRPKGCLNCHAESPSYMLPGFAIESVAVDRDGSSLETYRRGEIGHQVPLADRFGGWHLTGGEALANKRANVLGELSPQGLKTTANLPGQHFELKRYPVATSDLLPHLIHEHQVGFLNRFIQLSYLVRKTGATPGDYERLLSDFVDYVLFEKEAVLPAKGITGDPYFQATFLAAGSPASTPLRTLDLRGGVFKLKCSFMLAGPVWEAAPARLKADFAPVFIKKLANRPLADRQVIARCLKLVQ